MTFFIPNPKWEEPSILLPGVKPTGPVTIDWDNPFANRLRYCLYPDETAVGGIRDLVSDSILDYDTGSMKAVGDIGGLGHASSSGNGTFAPLFDMFTSSFLSVSSHTDYTTDTFGANIGPTFWMDAAGGELKGWMYAGAHRPMVYTISDNRPYILAAGIRYITAISSYYANCAVNGNLEFDALYLGNVSTYRDLALIGGLRNGLEVDKTVMYMRALWIERVFSIDECISLSNDPYQFIVPK